MQHDDYNIILVDWEPLAASTFYLGPMQNTVRVGKDAANFIDFLVSETDLKAEDVHFLGMHHHMLIKRWKKNYLKKLFNIHCSILSNKS